MSSISSPANLPPLKPQRSAAGQGASQVSRPAFDAASFLATLTEAPGVYRFIGAEDAVLYVGKAKNLKKRVSSYFQKTSSQSPRIALMLQQVVTVDITATRSEAEALILENTLIKKLSPRFNILFRDDKSYPYIMLSGGHFPRLAFHRGAFDKRSRYFGPFPSGSVVRESLKLLQKTFLLRTCEESVFAHRSRPCLLHQIHLCKGPCVGLVSQDEYAADVRAAELFLSGRHNEVITDLSARMEAAANVSHFEAAALLRDQIRALQAVLHRQYVSSTRDLDVDILALANATEGGASVCVNLAMVRGGQHMGDRAFFPKTDAAPIDFEEALTAFISQHYLAHPPPPRILLAALLPEEASTVFAERKVVLTLPRNEMERAWLSMAQKNADLALVSRRHARAREGSRLAALSATLNLAEPPARIECFDISHTLGEGTVASCVVCVNGEMKKSDYRRFNIRDIQAGDDYAAMRQALARRYERLAGGESVAPDLILIDGGKGQHKIAREVLHELNLDHLLSVGIAKGDARKPGLETLFVHGRAEPLHLPPDHAGFHLLQAIRDEAHRFAIAGHRAARAKARGRSRLEDVPSIGPTRRRKLLAQFGGLEGVQSATVEDLCRVSGISRRLAEEIYGALH